MNAHQPKSRSLVAAMMADEAAKRQARSAAEALANVPEIVDVAAWYTQHTALLHQLLHHAIKRVAAAPVSKQTQRVIQSLGRTHADLQAHTAKIAGPAVPRVLARDGVHTIEYDRLAEARAKVQVLTEELESMRAEKAWQPQFNVMSPKQETLALQFCLEIAGRRGEPGALPDPVRLLEMAQALYEAEREECAP
ncbi:hypothetical protein [Paracidovorax konjaci]|uniref:Uncharacterized protein n=1 Tax=Paracidovorax konjaci TaxID=32040 RepID=A0A1I1YJD4_9BURK|nr:hypothetical protein [Paracidovorax konjaci]SFE19657.1 hypothetical protein SAMN04489710_11847 [Paracidovorax konjaci]